MNVKEFNDLLKSDTKFAKWFVKYMNFRIWLNFQADKLRDEINRRESEYMKEQWDKIHK